MPITPAPGHQIGALQQTDPADAVIGGLADAQHGVVSRTQLLAAGITRRQIQRRLQAQRLRTIHRGVYAVGHRALSQEAVWMAAVLAAGEDSALSHWSAASLTRLRQGRGPRSHVTCPRKRRSSRQVAFHFADLPPDEVTVMNNIPATTPARTLLDLAATASIPSLTRMTAAAGLTEGTSLRDLLDRYPRKPGAAKLRAITARPQPMTRSDLEAAYIERFEQAGIPRPRVNAVIEGNEVDFVWDEHGVAAELDSYVTHGSRIAFEADRARDRKLAAAGWIVVRLTDEDPDDGITDLSRVLAASAARSPRPDAWAA